jgi:signal transduction histidine kinase
MSESNNLEARIDDLSIKLQETMLNTDLNDSQYLEKTIGLILTSVKDILHFNCAEFYLFKNSDGSIPKKSEIGPDPRKKTDLRLHWITGVGYEDDYTKDSRESSWDINNMPVGPPLSLFNPKFNFEPLPVYDNEEYMEKIGEEGRMIQNFLERMKKEVYDKEFNPADFPRGGFSEFIYQIYIPVTRDIPEGKEMIGIIGIDSPLDIPLNEAPDEERMKAVLKITKLAQAPLLTASMVYELKTTNNKLEATLTELKDAQDEIVRTTALVKYGEFSEQINHQINTLLLGIVPAVSQLEEVNNKYSKAVSKVSSLGLSEVDKARHSEIERFISENAAGTRVLTGLDFMKEKKKAREALSGITLDSVVDRYAKMQLPKEIGEELISIAKNYCADEIFESAYSLFESKKLLNTIKKSSIRISNLVAAVKDYTYGTEARDYNVRTGLDSTLIIMEVTLGGTIIKKNYESSALPKIDCYPGALDQVWTNIINNAVQAGAKNITIDAYQKDDKSVTVKIENDGPQIADDVIGHIFEKYFTTKKKENEEGKGLGLSMSKDIIEKQHSGKIEVYSSPEKTYFEVNLPIVRRE